MSKFKYVSGKTKNESCKKDEKDKILIIRYNANINNENISDYTKMYTRRISHRYNNEEKYYEGLAVYIIGSG